MKSMSCIILEDDLISLKVLQNLISRVPELDLIASYSDPVQALDYFERFQPDILFLDINMPGLNGFEFLNKLDVKPQTIFITGHADFALDAFKVGALDYLLKPFTSESFKSAINKAHIFFNGMSKKPLANDAVFIRSEGKYHRLQCDDIIYIQAMKDYAVVYTRSSQHVVAMNLTTILKQLPQNYFIRIHKSFAINFHNIDSFNNNSVTIGKLSIPVGKSYQEKLLNRMPSELVIKR
ncbi:MAG: response regulator transcription factor [Chitinophagaceae bacterium]|nr:response regulator transcription factor [Chitinophagaceae bacterium]